MSSTEIKTDLITHQELAKHARVDAGQLLPRSKWNSLSPKPETMDSFYDLCNKGVITDSVLKGFLSSLKEKPKPKKKPRPRASYSSGSPVGVVL